MFSWLQRWRTSPLLVRVVPFVIFAALTAGQGLFGEGSKYWIYLAKTVIGLWLIWTIWSVVSEMRWSFSWAAVGVGIGVFGLWIGLDGYYPKMSSSGKAWNPFEHFGAESGWAWLFVAVRILGSSLIVPPLEEVFYRSFLYRYIANADFQTVALGCSAWTPLMATSAVFGLAHFEWLPALLCGLAYQSLVIWKKRLGEAMTAHAVTNFLLGLWVIWKGAWHFW